MHWSRHCRVFFFLVVWVLPAFEGMFEGTGSNGAEREQDMTKFSQNGQDKLKLIEGFVRVVTKDLAGYPTIGYGHRVKPGEKFGAISETAALKIMM